MSKKPSDPTPLKPSDPTPLISLAEVRAAPVSDVVKILSDLLHKAKQGRLRGVAVVGEMQNGDGIRVIGLGDAHLDSMFLNLELTKRLILDAVETVECSEEDIGGDDAEEDTTPDGPAA